MSTEKRYLFQGHAVAAEAHIRQPQDHICWIQGAMALPVTGGYGKVDVPRTECVIPGRQSISFDSASAFVSGDFVGSQNDAAASAGPIRTVAAAYVNGLNVLGRLTVKTLAAHLVLEDSRQGQPRISFGTTNPITQKDEPVDPIVDLFIGKSRVKIDFDPIVRQPSTLDELQEKFRQRCGVEWYGGMIATSIVRGLSWDKNQPDGARINNNTIVLDNFGTIHIGELLVDRRVRQLTLLRLRLGSDGRDNDAFADVSTNGQGWPPTG